MKSTGVWGSVLVAAGLLAVFVAQQVLVPGPARTGSLVVGALAFVGALLIRVVERGRAAAAARTVETWLTVATVGVAVSMALYAATTDAGLAALGLAPDDDAGGVLWALWPAVLGVSVAALAFMEAAYRRMPLAEAVELRRVATAGIGGASLALALVFLTSINYVASQRDVVRDLSYFRTTAPSDASLRLVRQLGEKVEVVLFYPEVNEVRDQVVPYFTALAAAGPELEVGVRDHALSPELAREHRIRGNGWVLLLRGEGDARQAESFEIGTDLEAARGRLRKLDDTFQRSFTKLTRQRREIALTTGHGERNDARVTRPEGEGIDKIEDALERANVTIEKLGVAQGLAAGVPDGTPAVMVVGPEDPFLPEEAAALVAYVRRGGRLALFVDPDVDAGLDPVLRALGVAIQPGVLASEANSVVRTRTDADRAIVYTTRYSSHPTVTVASRNAAQLATVLLRGGALVEHEGEGRLEGAKVSFPVRSTGQFWRDLDGDFARDPDTEPEETANLMAVVTIPNDVAGAEEGRAVVIADGDFATDQLMRVPFANAFVVQDILNWFLGEEQIIGEATSEEDVRVELRKDEDALLFYGTSFGIPLPLLGIGALVAVRRRGRRGPPTPREGAGPGARSEGPRETAGAVTPAEADRDGADGGDDERDGADRDGAVRDEPVRDEEGPR